MLYQLISLDVCGNAREGYDINDLREEGVFFQLREEGGAGKKGIISALKRIDFIRKRIRESSIEFELDDYMGEIGYKGRPVYQLRRSDKKPDNLGSWFIYAGDFPFHARPAILFTETKNGSLRRVKG